MSQRHRPSFMLSLCLFFVLCTVVLAACGETGATTPTKDSSAVNTQTQNISLGLGYKPDIQFAPFYVAKSKGYYQQAGLNVTFNHGIVTNLIGSMATGKNTFVFASGDELLVAADKTKDLKAIDVANVFQKYPVSLIVPAESPIKTLADLKGKTIGEPGPFGATHTGLLALLYKANLSLTDVKAQSIGFNQVSALLTKKVDAVMGYSNNEPLQLEKSGMKVRTFVVSDYQPLVSNGVMTTEATYTGQTKMVSAFVQATLKGLQDVINNPQEAVELSKATVPGMDPVQALAVLKATIPIYKGDGKLGYNDEAAWKETEKFLVAQKMIGQQSDLSKLYTNKLLP